MPNWSFNSVVFTADEDKQMAIKQLFADIEEKQLKDDHYHLLSFATTENCFMTDIVFDRNRIMFETRWVPNTELLMEIADFYKAGFVSKFEEMQMEFLARRAMKTIP